MKTGLQRAGTLEPPGKALARPVRVLHYLFFPGGGIGRYAHELLEHLATEEGVQVELACPPTYEWKSRASYDVWDGLLPLRTGNAVLRRMRFLRAQFANPLRALRHAEAGGCDVLHLSNINHLSFPIWSRAARASGIRVVATAHDVRRAKAMIHRGYESRQLAAFYRSADALFVHSRHQRGELLEYAECEPERVHIVPHGPYDYGSPSAPPDELRRRMGLPGGKQIALFFGQIRDEKNLELLIRSLPPHRDAVHLVVAGHAAGGGHASLEHYRRLTDELSLTDSVTFHDEYVPDERIADYFVAADWVALPYGRSFTSQSGVLNVAAHYRRPLLLSDTPTFRETVETCNIGLLVPPDDVDALRNGVAAMLQASSSTGDSWEFDSYRRSFGWEANVRTTVAVYRSLVEGAERT